jgi:hypothetical protein
MSQSFPEDMPAKILDAVDNMMQYDPRIRGVCPNPPNKPKLNPRPALNYAGQYLGSGFRKGSVVLYDGVKRFVFCVGFYYQIPGCNFKPGSRIVMSLNLGGNDTKVPWDKVKLLTI